MRRGVLRTWLAAWRRRGRARCTGAHCKHWYENRKSCESPADPCLQTALVRFYISTLIWSLFHFCKCLYVDNLRVFIALVLLVRWFCQIVIRTSISSLLGHWKLSLFSHCFQENAEHRRILNLINFVILLLWSSLV